MKTMFQTGPGRPLPSTLWSEVLSAGGGSTRALESLVSRYLGPVYGFLRRSGKSKQDAEDLAQEFFLFLMESEAIGKADRNRGRFRSFLLTCVRNFVLNESKRERAQKRGGDRKKLSLDVEGAERILELQEEKDPAAQFDRHWATEMLGRALSRLGERVGPQAAQAFALANGAEGLTHKQIGDKLGMTENAVAVSVSRTRKSLRDLLVEEVRETVDSEEAVAAELQDLFRSFSGSGFEQDIV